MDKLPANTESYVSPTLGSKRINPKTKEVWQLTADGWKMIGREGESVLPDLTKSAKVGRGVMDIAQGLKQGYYWLTDDDKFKDYTKQVDEELKMYESGRNRQGERGMDWSRIAGQGLATAPLGLMKQGVTLPGQVIKNTLQGSTAGAAMYNKGGDFSDKLFNTIAGGAGGATTPLAMKGLKFAGNKSVNAVKNVWRNIKPKDMSEVRVVINQRLAADGIEFDKMPLINQKELMNEASEQLRKTGALDADAIARKARAESLGFTGNRAPTSSQVTRNPKQWTRERNLAKVEDVGDEITERYQQQSSRFSELGDEMIVGTGGKANDIVDTNESIVKAITGKWKSTQEEVGNLYNQITNQYGDTASSTLGGFSNYIDDISWDETIAPVTKSAKNLLLKHGVIKRTVNEAGEELYQATGKQLPVKEIESIRKKLGVFYGNKDPNISRAGRDVITALDDDVFNSVGDDVYSEARAAASKRFSDFESKVGNTMKKITRESISEDDAYNSVMKSKSEELQAIKDNMLGKNISDKTGEGLEAWKNIQKQTLSNLWDKATQTGKFSGAVFKKELEKIGKKKLNILFENAVNDLETIAKVGIDLTEDPAFSAVNYSNTAPTWANLMKRSGLPYISKMGDRSLQDIEKTMYLSGTPVDRSIDMGATQALVDKYIVNPLKPAIAPSLGMTTIGGIEDLRESIFK